MSAIHTDGKWLEVSGSSETIADTVIADGEVWELRRFAGAGAYLDDTTVCLVWDRGGGGEEILACTHGDQDKPMVRQVIGDGVKKLSIVLTNDTANPHVMGGEWEARHISG